MESWLKENWFKAGILIALFVVAYSIYYTQVIKPNDEKNALVTERAANKKSLDTCLSDADSSYSDNWYRECKSSGALTNKCIDVHELTYQQYLTKYNLTENEYYLQRGITSTSTFAGVFDYVSKMSDECSCRLPLANADRLNATLKDGKDACYKLYPQQ